MTEPEPDVGDLVNVDFTGYLMFHEHHLARSLDLRRVSCVVAAVSGPEGSKIITVCSTKVGNHLGGMVAKVDARRVRVTARAKHRIGCVEAAEDVSVETIASAAICVDGEVWSLPRPARHHILIRAWSDAHWIHDPKTKTGRGSRLPNSHVQGFMTSKNRFVDRAEAERVARAAGQVTGEILGGELTSEDLW